MNEIHYSIPGEIDPHNYNKCNHVSDEETNKGMEPWYNIERQLYECNLISLCTCINMVDTKDILIMLIFTCNTTFKSICRFIDYIVR